MNQYIKDAARLQPFAAYIKRLSAKWQAQTTPEAVPSLDSLGTTEQLLASLVAIPTISGSYDAIHQGLDCIEAYLGGFGMFVKRFEWNGVESLVATTRDTKTPEIFLVAHLDVVAGQPELFELRSDEKNYYGRGVLDMKGALAAYLGAIRELKDNLSEYDFGIMITSDEETGGFDGAQRLAEEGYIPKAVVLPDGGANNWDIEKSCKGIWWFTIEAHGKDGHGSRPWEGVNAIDIIVEASSEIKALFGEPGPETTTISMDVVSGGKTMNQIPAKASAGFDVRYTSMEELKHIYARINEVVQKYQLTLTTEVEADPIINDTKSLYLKTYKEITEEIIGRPVNWVVSNAGNDGRFFAQRGSQCIVAYPVGDNHHGSNESIRKECLLQMQQLFIRYLQAVAGNSQGKQ